MSDISTFKTTLNDRILCGDGDSIVGLPFLYNHILAGNNLDGLFLAKRDYVTDEVQFHNTKFPKTRMDYKTKMNDTSFEWEIPKRFKELNVTKFLAECLKTEIADAGLDEDEKSQRISRVKMEMDIWKKRNLLDLLRTLIFIVNTLEENNIVWGTGRGSSCASYVLYLIGLHQVDSVLYDIEIGEFFR